MKKEVVNFYGIQVFKIVEKIEKGHLTGKEFGIIFIKPEDVEKLPNKLKHSFNNGEQFLNDFYKEFNLRYWYPEKDLDEEIEGIKKFKKIVEEAIPETLYKFQNMTGKDYINVETASKRTKYYADRFVPSPILTYDWFIWFTKKMNKPYFLKVDDKYVKLYTYGIDDFRIYSKNFREKYYNNIVRNKYLPTIFIPNKYNKTKNIHRVVYDNLGKGALTDYWADVRV